MAITKNKVTTLKPATKAVTPPTTAKAAPKPAAKAAPKAETKKVVQEVEAVEVVRVGRKQLAEMVREIVMSTGVAISPKVAEVAVIAYEEAVTECLKQGAVVAMPGFGTFSGVDRAESIRPNPQKPGETVTIAPHRAPKFKPGAALKKALNESEEEEEEGEEEGGE